MSFTTLSTNHVATIKEEHKAQGFKFIHVEHQYSSAVISLYGGQVLSWQPAGEKDVFWLSNDAIFEDGKAIRGGIPLCWPWFGPYKDGAQHGFARQVHWQLDKYESAEDGVTIILSWQGENINPLWPHPAKLVQTLFFGKTFRQSLAMHNLSDQAVSYSCALHSYFKVSSPDNVTVPFLDNSEFDDKLTGQRIKSMPRKNCQGPIDTVYYNNASQQLIDNKWQRVINITTEHSHQWVLWNPGKAMAAKMADVHAGGEQQYVCLEAASTQWQTIPANQHVVISQSIAVESLD